MVHNRWMDRWKMWHIEVGAPPKNKDSFQWHVLNQRGFPTFMEWLLLWCFQIVFWMIWVFEWFEHVFIYLTLIRRKRCDNLMPESMWHKICRRFASISEYPLCRFNNHYFWNISPPWEYNIQETLTSKQATHIMGPWQC